MKPNLVLSPVFLVLWVVFQGIHGSQQLESPYTFVCEEKLCTKKLKTEAQNVGTSLNVCKLTCDDMGSLWPKPTGNVNIGKEIVSLYPSKITLENAENPAPIMSMVQEAFTIFQGYLKKFDSESDEEVKKHDLKVVLKASSDSTQLNLFPTPTDESYTLTISTTVNSSDNTTNVVANITAATFFGVRHGLETLSQLIAYDDVSNVLQIVSNASVEDKPVFPYRGIMLDTSRNYYAIDQLKKLIDGMSYNKLSVFHWHITDSHSFPMEIEKYPQMLQYGAYSSEKVYKKADIQELVMYARQRGVKIIPELDQPAHSGYGYQWGKEEGKGDLVVCLGKEPWYDFCVEPVCGQLNIVNNNVTEIVGDILSEMLTMFDKDIFHMGGDEVDFRCYNTTEQVTDWMKANNMNLDNDGFYKLWGDFQDTLLKKLYNASKSLETKAIMWTSGLTHTDRIETFLDKNKYIIQIWTNSNDEMIGSLLDKGYKTIFSNVDALYLDCGYQAWLGNGHNWCSPIVGWQTVYDNDPEKIYAKSAGNDKAEKAVKEGQILGSEAPLWSEQADDKSLQSRIFPRAAAHAERTWSHPKTNHSEAEIRMVTNRNRMVERGIDADRLQPEYCLQNEGKCYAAPASPPPPPPPSSGNFLQVSQSVIGFFSLFVLLLVQF